MAHSTASPSFLSDTIDKLQALIAEDRRDANMLASVLLGAGYIVVSHSGLPLNFTITGKGERRVASAAQIAAHAGRVVRFTRMDAELLAFNVTDGAGRPARAVHVVDAIAAQIAEREQILASLLNVAERMTQL